MHKISIITFIKELLDNPVAKERFEHCIQCSSFNQITSQCRNCGCFMRAKVFLPNAQCPENKW